MPNPLNVLEDHDILAEDWRRASKALMPNHSLRAMTRDFEQATGVGK